MSENKMTIEEFIGKLAKWDPITAFKDLKIPVQRNRKGEIKNPKVIGIVDNIYSDTKKSVKLEWGEEKPKIEKECVDGIKKEYVKYETREICIEDNEWGQNAGRIRRENLKNYLEGINPSRLFVGEAPGIKGCCRTGIPFTSEAIISGTKKIEVFSKNFEYEKFKTISKDKEKKQTERTSTIVWRCLDQLCEKGFELPLLWNIYPFHPWKYEGSEKKNRFPIPEECKIGIGFLWDLLECFGIQEIYLIGKKANETLAKIEESPEKEKYAFKYDITHPSYQGVTKFVNSLNEIYQDGTKESEETDE